MCPVLFHSGTHVRGLWETLGLTGIRGQGMKGGEGLHLLHPPRWTTLSTFQFLTLAWAKGTARTAAHPLPSYTPSADV